MKFLQKKIDVFVNLLTRCARSPIYQALPFVFDKIFEAAGHDFGAFGCSVGQWVWPKDAIHPFSGRGRGKRFLINNTEQLFQTSNTLRNPELYFSQQKPAKLRHKNRYFAEQI